MRSGNYVASNPIPTPPPNKPRRLVCHRCGADKARVHQGRRTRKWIVTCVGCAHQAVFDADPRLPEPQEVSETNRTLKFRFPVDSQVRGSDTEPAMADDVTFGQDEAGDPVMPTPYLEFPRTGVGSLQDWRAKIEASKETIKTLARDFTWNKNVERYVAKGLQKAPEDHTVVLPKDYSYTERKKPLLLYQFPEVVLSPARSDVTPETAALLQAVLNYKACACEMNVKSAIDEYLIDTLLPAGVGILKLGYEAFV